MVVRGRKGYAAILAGSQALAPSIQPPRPDLGNECAGAPRAAGHSPAEGQSRDFSLGMIARRPISRPQTRGARTPTARKKA
ncbi:hypothetical protein DB31_5634 [Hyalangium minutum]|uniref:Uncharacterized protein n=1 Tax=Hyalangium minutum TaxID=394096 RepID=A0A085WSC9_9BACT|nr:hypothetical protein DB31_5634 [Hyalangium minutum]